MEIMNTDTPETDGEWNRLACQDHPEFERNLADFARKLERERDEARKRAETMFAEHVDIIDQALYGRDELREDLEFRRGLYALQTEALEKAREERDEARQWESQALVARIQRDRVSKTLGEVREILCDALPNENQLTSFMAVKLVRERDDLRKSRAEVVGKYQAAVKEMHETGAQRNEAIEIARKAMETVMQIYGHAQFCDECQSFEIADSCRIQMHDMDRINSLLTECKRNENES
jgi:hypothetical protein